MVDRVYFRDPTKEEEKEIIELAEKRFRSSRCGSIVAWVLGVLFLLASIGMFIYLSSDLSAGLGLLLLAVICIIIGFVNNSSSKAVINDFRQGHFLVQDIEVVDMLFQDPHCQDTYALALRSKEGDAFDLPVSSDRYKEFHIGMKGLLAVMYGETGLFKSGRFFFISEKETDQMNEEAFESSFSSEGGASELPSSILSSFSKKASAIPLILLICELPYVIGFLIALQSFQNSGDPKGWTPPLAIASFISTFFLFFGYRSFVVLDYLLKKGKRSFVMFILWLCLLFIPMFVNAIALGGAPLEVFLLAHFICFVAIGIFVFMFSYKRRAISRGLKNGTIKWARGTIIHTVKHTYAISRRGTIVPFITVRLNNGGTVHFDVFCQNIVRDLRTGVTGYVIRVEDTFRGETVAHYYFEKDPGISDRT
ncbi:MAG: hypothetical protein IKX04_05370 [Clostridiales bacterium]|nr:hypothetical protein [Clostridiales bacterium]